MAFFWWSKDREGYWKEGLYIEYFWFGRGGECWYWNWLIEERVAVSHQPPFQQQVFSNVLTEVLQWIYSTQYLKLQVSLMDWRIASGRSVLENIATFWSLPINVILSPPMEISWLKEKKIFLYMYILYHILLVSYEFHFDVNPKFALWLDLKLRKWRARVQVAWVFSLRIWLFWGSAL